MIENFYFAIIVVAIFLFLSLIISWMISFFSGEKPMVQSGGFSSKKTEGNDNTEDLTNKKEIGTGDTVEKETRDENTEVFDDNKNSGDEKEKIKKLCNVFLNEALQEKREKREKYKKSKIRMEEILEGTSLLPALIRKIWKRRKLLGEKCNYLNSEKMHFGIRSLEFQNSEKKIVLDISSYCDDYSRIERVLISASMSSEKFFYYKEIEKLTAEEFEETEKLLEEINAD